MTKSILIELDSLVPKQNEEDELLKKRALVANSTKLIEILDKLALLNLFSI